MYVYSYPWFVHGHTSVARGLETDAAKLSCFEWVFTRRHCLRVPRAGHVRGGTVRGRAMVKRGRTRVDSFVGASELTDGRMGEK